MAASPPGITSADMEADEGQGAKRLKGCSVFLSVVRIISGGHPQLQGMLVKEGFQLGILLLPKKKSKPKHQYSIYEEGESRN